MKMRLVINIMVVLVSGCASYGTVGPGTLDYNGLTIQTSQAWNLAPKEATPSVRSEAKVWTQDGILLDRMIIIPGVPSGESLFEVSYKGQALPVFKADMLPNEIAELAESSIAKLFGEGEVAVETADLRDHRYGENSGMLFDISMMVSDGPSYRGVAGALVVNERLYLILYLGAEPYFYEKHLDEALVIIKGARV